MTTVRETKRADELKPGDRVWIDDSHVEILLAEPYNDSFNGVGVFLTYRYLKTRVESVRVPASVDFILVSDEELAAAAAGVERARKIADIRALADFLEANPEVPLALYPSEQVDLHNGAASVAQVRELGAKFGGTVRDDLDDRTQVYLKFGSFEYRVIAWHHDGRPAEPAPEPLTPAPIAEHYDASAFNTENVCACGDAFGSRRDLNAHILGLAYSRADDEQDDPTPVSGARVEPHVGAVTEQGLVDETPRPVHFRFIGGDTLCGLAEVPDTAGWTNMRGSVTCQACANAVPLDGC